MKSSKHLLFAVGLTAILSACSSKEAKEDTTATKEVEKPLVRVELVTLQNVPVIGEYTATVEANKTNNITTNTPNRIKKILVEVGNHVQKGQTVVILDDVNTEQMKLRLANMKTELDRATELYNIGGGTKQAVDQIKTEYDATSRSYKNMLENATLTSPITGVVTARNYDNGDMTGQLPILTIEEFQPVKIVVNVSEQEFTKVYLGMPVTVKLDVYGDEVFEGKVSLISPTIDPATRTFQVEIRLPNAKNRVRPGMFARVTMNFGTNSHVVVPDMAVIKQPGSGNRYVFVYKDGKVSYQKVELGQRIDNTYELLSGVEDNSYVVVNGQSALIDGVEVEIMTDSVK